MFFFFLKVNVEKSFGSNSIPSLFLYVGRISNSFTSVSHINEIIKLLWWPVRALSQVACVYIVFDMHTLYRFISWDSIWNPSDIKSSCPVLYMLRILEGWMLEKLNNDFTYLVKGKIVLSNLTYGCAHCTHPNNEGTYRKWTF